MTVCEELRQAVLQAAIQGKLTEQREEDGTAEELFREIQGTRPKGKKLSPINEDEIPFDIPENWMWTNLVSLGGFSSGKTPSKDNPEYWNNGKIPWITSKDMKDKYLRESQINITKLAASQMTMYPKGTLLMVVRSGILKRTLPVSILTMESTINQDLKAYTLFDLRMSDYIYYMLKGLEQNILQNYTKRVTTVDSLRFDEFSTSMPVPLPPLAEQHRIVKRVNLLMEKIDSLQKIEDELTAIKRAFPGSMRESILQAAMQGKLTEQLDSDGTAEELFKEIQEEKKRLIKEGKIKKEKVLAPITEDEIPFDIPENWKWVRLGTLGYFTRGNGIKRDDIIEEGYPCVRYGQLYTTYKTSFENALSHTSKEIYDKAIKIKNGDVIMALTGENNFDIALAVAYLGDEEVAIGGDMTKYSHFIDPLYLVWSLNAAFSIKVKSNLATGNIIVHISNDKLATLPVPLAPLAEQHRIVARLNELLPLCEETLPLP